MWAAYYCHIKGTAVIQPDETWLFRPDGARYPWSGALVPLGDSALELRYPTITTEEQQENIYDAMGS